MTETLWDQNGTRVRRVVAPNPSPMTFTGTNTYILGTGEVAVIDPGPDLDDHLRAILGALDPGERVSHVLVTHNHRDHSPLAAALSERTQAPVFAFGLAHEGRSQTMEILANKADIGGGEGIDEGFSFDRSLSDGEVVSADTWSVTAIHTPGHLANHLCFASGDVLFSGDHVMGWATSLVSPPDGDLGAFMRSAQKLLPRGEQVYFPGHGDPVQSPRDRVRWLIDHRRGREAQILDQLGRSKMTIAALTAAIYADVAPALHGAASRNVLAHLIDLVERRIVEADPEIGLESLYKLR